MLPITCSSQSQSRETKPVCKYLGIIDFVKMELSVLISKLYHIVHYVPRSLIINYHSSKVVPILQHIVVIYGCSTYTQLEPIHTEKNPENHFFLENEKISHDLFEECKL